jgi:hypothetical protein
MRAKETHRVILRLPTPLYTRIKQLAAERRVSVNQFARERLQEVADQALAQELRNAYETLAEDPEATDVEFFIPAAREILGYVPE